MKVGLVSPYDFASPGGVTDHVRNLAAQLRDQGFGIRQEQFEPPLRHPAYERRRFVGSEVEHPHGGREVTKP